MNIQRPLVTRLNAHVYWFGDSMFGVNGANLFYPWKYVQALGGYSAWPLKHHFNGHQNKRTNNVFGNGHCESLTKDHIEGLAGEEASAFNGQ